MKRFLVEITISDNESIPKSIDCLYDLLFEMDDDRVKGSCRIFEKPVFSFLHNETTNQRAIFGPFPGIRAAEKAVQAAEELCENYSLIDIHHTRPEPISLTKIAKILEHPR